MDYTPKFSLHDTTPRPLATRKPETAPSDHEQHELHERHERHEQHQQHQQHQQARISPSPQSEPESFSSRSGSYMPPYSVNQFGPSSERSYRPLHNPPTPIPEDNDKMDWTPTQRSFQPVASARGQRYPQTSDPQTQPSPFYGRLPPAPICLAHKLRNPPNRPTFHKTPPKVQENFFKNVTGRSSTLDDQGKPTEAAADYPEMAPPRFFPKSATLSDTGLESLFAGVFSLNDEPPEVRTARQEQEAQDPSYYLREPPPEAAIRRKFSILLLFLATLAWTSVEMSSSMAVATQVAALFIAAAVAGKHLVEAMNMNKAFWSVSDILLFTCELAAAISLTSAVTSPNVGRQDGGRQEGVDILGPGLLIVLTIQEIWVLVSSPKTGTGSSIRGSVPPTPTEPSSSEPVTTEPLPSTSQQSYRQQAVYSTPLVQPQPRPEARTTRSMSKATAAVGSPSSGLSGLSLGGTGGLNDGTNYGAWSNGRRGSVPRNTQRGWERGVL